MHYLDEGDGPVVLMLHGNPTWSFFYRNLVRTLVTAGFRCIVPDHIGCGLSDKPQDYPYTLERRIKDIERLVDSLEISQFSLVVHDWGGAIGCGFAVRRPEALKKLVVLNTAAFRSKRIPWRIAAVKIPVIGEFIIRRLNGFSGPAVTMAVTSRLPGPVREGYLWPYRNWEDRVAIWNFVKDIPLSKRHRSYATLLEIETSLFKLNDKPVQIVWGGKDFCFNASFLEKWRKLFPKAELNLYKACGHYILEDSGAEGTSNIKSFLTA
jgi:haloalkane dehalogenase